MTNIAGVTSTLTVPDVRLGWTISPRLDVGLRLPNCGEVAIAYRYLTAEGNGTVHSAVDGALAVRSRLDVNLFDIYYGSPITQMAPGLDFKWRAGIRTAFIFYDTQASNPTLNTHATNYFVGSGPEGGMEIDWKLPALAAFALFGRADGAVLVGQIDQNYTIQNPSVPVSPINGEMELRRYQTVPVLGVQGGLHFAPPGLGLKFSIGYALEHWWSLGQLNNARLDLTTQGPFLRGEIAF